MLPGNQSVFWPLRLIVAMSVALPAALFVYATWQNGRSIERQTDQRIESTLDVLQEHALKALQTVERSISETNEVLRDVSDEAIRSRESDFYLRFKRTQQALPQIEAIWAFDRDGHPLASSTILPVPRTLDNSERSYFSIQKERDVGTYVGEVVRAKIGGTQFFVMSGRREGRPGAFDGIVAVTVMPEHFLEFYRKLTRGRDTFSLVRTDGSVLARWPEPTAANPQQLPPLADLLQSQPDGSPFTLVSRIDGTERRVGYRRVAGFPVFVTAGVDVGSMTQQKLSDAVWNLTFGLPVTLAIFGLSLYALRRSERFEAEVARREIAEAALKQSQRLEAIGQLTGGVAHDFNNLLMIVSGSAELLKKREDALDERARQAIQGLQVAVKRGSDLTRQLLSFARRQQHEARVIDLNERLPALQTMLRSSLRGDIEIEIEIAAEAWRTKVDVSEFELALLNLAVNARDAMPNGGRLAIRAGNVRLAQPNPARLTGDFVAVSVTDTGVGIAPETLARVFEPFFTTKEVGKGTGLGLSQVYGFARQAGGRATIESAVGRGTTVTLYLPRSDEAVQAEEGGASAVPSASIRRRILLVEDNPEVARVTRSLLEQAGYVVDAASDVASARAKLADRNNGFDIVLSDIVMPGGLTGIDLARWIRREYGPDLPIVLATGYSDRVQTATDEGFTILRKPYDAAVLGAALRDALARASGRQEG